MTEKDIEKFNEYMKMIGCNVYMLGVSEPTLLIGSVNIEELRIPDGVEVVLDCKNVEPECFSSEMKRVRLPDSVKRIGAQAFEAHQNLEHIIGGKNVETIGRRAFSNCKSLNEAVFPNMISMEEEAFQNCIGITYADIGNAPIIANFTFYGCYKLKRVKAVEATEIFGWAFEHCKELEAFEGSKVTTLGKNAFSSCISLKKLDFSPEEIGTSAFFNSGIETMDFRNTRRVNLVAFNNSMLKGDITLTDCEILKGAFSSLTEINVEIRGNSSWEEDSFEVIPRYVKGNVMPYIQPR